MSLKPIRLHETIHDIDRIARRFGIEGDLVEGGSFGNGLVNDTLIGTFESGGRRRRYVLQRINTRVFTDPTALMRNVDRVCAHLRARLEAGSTPDLDRRCLTLLRGPDGLPYHHDTEKALHWRCYRYINHCTSHDVVRRVEHAYEAARKFGEFQKLVADLPGPRLTETIPHFHDTPRRLQALEAAIVADPLDRAKDCAREIAFARSREPLAPLLQNLNQAGDIPERITHNDTKLSNVLLCDLSGRGMCVVDLDTVMPGLTLHDFGDLVRTCVSPGEEDSTDLSTVQVRLPVFEALARGFLRELGGLLTPAERTHLAASGKLLAYEVGMRFLTDHLLGDTYFTIRRPNHNLDRCRNQFRLVECLENQEPALNAIVRSLLPS